MEITFDGPKTHVVLNGVTVNDFDMNSPVPPREKWFEPERGPRALLGYIGLQNHDTGSTVRYKEVSFRGK